MKEKAPRVESNPTISQYNTIYKGLYQRRDFLTRALEEKGEIDQYELDWMYDKIINLSYLLFINQGIHKFRDGYSHSNLNLRSFIDRISNLLLTIEWLIGVLDSSHNINLTRIKHLQDIKDVCHQVIASVRRQMLNNLEKKPDRVSVETVSKNKDTGKLLIPSIPDPKTFKKLELFFKVIRGRIAASMREQNSENLLSLKEQFFKKINANNPRYLLEHSEYVLEIADLFELAQLHDKRL
jgi:hypothetical protein